MAWRDSAAVLILLLMAGRFALAESTAADLLAQARAALANGDNDRAAQLADRAVRAEPENPSPYLFRAGLMEALGESEKALSDYDAVVRLAPGDAGGYQRRGVMHFKLGRFKESVADFDKVLELRPAEKPYHWQRGISLYYAGEFEAGREQFELHQTVNRNDVENAAWHYLCVARSEGVEKARASLIPIVGDPRVPMAQVHDLYAGTGTARAVLEAANKVEALGDGERVKGQLFYAHLYLGLYYEAAGDAAKAREHMDLAAGEFGQDHYMGEVARVHAKLLGKSDDARDREEAVGAAPPARSRSRLVEHRADGSRVSSGGEKTSSPHAARGIPPELLFAQGMLSATRRRPRGARGSRRRSLGRGSASPFHFNWSG